MGKYIDTRDLEKRRDELQAEYDDLVEALEDASDNYRESGADGEIDLYKEEMEAVQDALDDWTTDYKEELDELTNLSGEVSEWEDGNTLIPEGDWLEYVQDLLEDIGAIPRNIPNYIVIDWEATADNIAEDYQQIDYQEEVYYVRN